MMEWSINHWAALMLIALVIWVIYSRAYDHGYKDAVKGIGRDDEK